MEQSANSCVQFVTEHLQTKTENASLQEASI